MTCPTCFVQTGGASKPHTRKRPRAPSRPSLSSSAPSTRTKLTVRNRRQTGYFHRAIVLAEKLETNFSSKACKQFVQDLKTKYKGAKIDPKDSPTEAIEKVFALEEDTGVDKAVSPPPSKRAKRGPSSSSSASSSSSTKRSTTAKKRAGRRRVWLTVLGLLVAAGVGGVTMYTATGRRSSTVIVEGETGAYTPDYAAALSQCSKQRNTNEQKVCGHCFSPQYKPDYKFCGDCGEPLNTKTVEKGV